MLSSKKFKLQISKKWYAFLAFIVFGGLFAWSFLAVIAPGADERPDDLPPPAGASQIKNTGFRGDGVNISDPVAVQAYCDDVLSAASQGEGAKIRDLCALNEVLREYLPKLSVEEIESYAENEPTCLQTGYDRNGYNCFTGNDRNGCSKSGINEEGKECRGSVLKPVDTIEKLLGSNNQDVCDIVSGCQTEQAFGPDGLNKFGCNRQGRNEDGEFCPAEYITRLYGDDGRDQLGFNRKGFNDKNCDAQGFKDDGTECELDDVTLVYDRNNFDQFGLNQAGFNDKACNLDGLDENGKVCSIEDIPRIFDKNSGLDQFGLGRDGFNAKGCDLNGYDRNGDLCSIDDIPRIYGSDGFDQLGLRKNGRNANNCDINGLKPNGDICSFDEMPRLFSPITGTDQYGFFPNGFNENDCDVLGRKPNGTMCSQDEITRIISEKTGLDALGVSADGYALNGCNSQGFRRDGSRCALGEIPRVFDKTTGLDQFNLKKDGFNQNGCGLDGLRKDGSLCPFEDITSILNPDTGYDQLGLNSDGLNENGCGLDGLDANGRVCEIENITRIFDKNTGLDQFGLDADGFDPLTDCNLDGFDRNGARCDYKDIPKIIGDDGINQLGLNASGENEFGCDVNGRKEDGTLCSDSEMSTLYDESGVNMFHKDKDGFSRLKLNSLGFNENNCDINGLTPDGVLCASGEITRVYDATTGLDQFGLDKQGLNEWGCGLDGNDVNGKRCKEEHVPRIFDKDMNDQFGTPIEELPESVWVNEQGKVSGLTALLDKNGLPVLRNGKQVFVDKYGVLREVSGRAVRAKNGGLLRLDKSTGNIVDRDGVVDDNFTNLSGSKITGKVSAVGTLEPILDENGDQAHHNGKPVFSDKDGVLRYSDGTPVLDSSGGLVKLSRDGVVRDSLGNEFIALTDRRGDDLRGKLAPSSGEGLAALLDDSGNAAYHNGRQVFKDSEGVLRYRDGSTVVDEDGNSLSIDGNGVIRDSSGRAVEPLENDLGQKIRGPLSDYDTSTQSALLNKSGERVHFNGKPVFVDGDGKLRYADGTLARDRNGKDIYVTEDGLIKNSDGDMVTGLTDKNGKLLADGISGFKQSQNGELLDKDGNSVYYDGKKVFTDATGALRYEDGSLVLNKDGESLKLGDDGEIRDTKGRIFTELTSKDGKLIADGLSGFKKSENRQLLDADGNQVYHDGKKVFTDATGALRYEDGTPVLNKDGELLKLGANGEIRDAKGRVFVDLTDKDGKLIADGLSGFAKGANGELLGADGNQVYHDGKKVFTDATGALRYEDGSPVLNKDGESLKLGADGEIRDAKGRVFTELTDKDGKLIADGISGFKASDNSLLLDADGNQVYHDGKKVFTDATGALRYEDGTPVLNKDGESLKLGANGEIRDAKGRVFSELTDKDGKFIADGISGFKASDNSLLLDANGNQVYHDGKKVFTDATGALRYEDGTSVLNKDGESLKLGANGEIRDAKGRVFSELTDKDGKLIADGFSGFKKNENLGLVDADGNQVYHDGKKVFASADGSLRYEDGTPVLNKEGALLKLGANGEIRDTKGNVFSDFTDGNGEPLTGGFSKSQDLGKRSLLLGLNGETAHYKGDPVYVNADGFLADKNGRVMLDENGSPLRINSKGQIVNANGRVIPSSDFTDVLGEKMEGGMVVSQPLSQSEVEAKSLAEKLSKSEILALNLDADGYNSSGCGLNGLNRLGEICNMADIPRSFDSVTGLDQLGFGRDNYNAFGCDIDGLDRKGSVCLDEYVTRIFDGDGFDQFGVNDAGLNRAGLNAKGENALGCDATGENCSASTTPKLTDSAGVDQFNKNATGRDRLNLINGFNDKGCGVDGLDAKGDICSLSDIPLFLNADGFNQFGIDESGRNRFGCDIEGLKPDGTRCTLNETPRIFNKTGFDQFGIDATGRNKFGCDLNGFKIDGSRCEDSETPKLYDKFGFDQFGIAYNGFNKKGCDIDGKREDGTSCSIEDLTRIFNPSTGLDQFNLTKDGLNDVGCGLDGLSREGELCAAKDIPRVYGDDEIDQLGFGKDGFNAQGCDFYGYNRKGELCDAKDLTRVFDKNNMDQYGADKLSGRNENGCDLNGLLPNGQRCKPANKIIFRNAQGVGQHGLINGFNQNGCDINGIDKEGNRCDIDDVTRIIDPDTGRDQLGMDKNLTNKFGCDINGQDKDGKACDPKQITRWFDGSDKDQFGTNRQGFNDLECNLLGYKADGTKCAASDVPSFYGKDGINQLGFNSQGFGRDNLDDEGYDKDGCDIDNLNRKREACSKYQGLGLSVADGAYIAAKKTRMLEWLAETNGVVSSKPIAIGSYVANDDPVFAVSAPVVVAQTQPVIVTGIGAQSQIDGILPDATVTPEIINIPAGYMTAIYVDTAVNSDYTDTVYAKISMGELEGATLIGRPVVPYVDDPVMPRDKFYYEFDRLVYNRQTISIDAVSINRYNDSGMVEADDVDYHRFQRYGGLITAAAIQALDASFLDSQAESDFRAQNDAIEQAIGASPLIYGENTRDLTKQNLKTATQFATDLAKQQFNRRPTVSKGYGPQMIVFKTQVQDDRLPLVMIGLD
jgi:flagellar basal body rod protein FlgG